MADSMDKGDRLRETFADYPADEALTTIQNQHRVKINSLHPALPLLDLHGLRRFDVYSSLLHVLSNQLQSRLDDLEARPKERLLESVFSVVDRDEMRPILMRILRTMHTIPDKYLSFLAGRVEDERIYNSCPLEVKRKLWEYDSRLYGETVSPLLDQYITDKEEVLYSNISGTSGNVPRRLHRGMLLPIPFYSIPSKQRRESAVIRELAEMIGDSDNLYKTLVQFLRTLYLRTHVSHYCTLRSDVTMILHDNKVTAVLDKDLSYKFTWILDACINMKHIDGKKLRELIVILDTYSDSNSEVLGDLAIILRDPYALHCIASSIIKLAQELAEREILPRENGDIASLVRLLDLGLKSWDILEQQDYGEDKLDTALITKFLPDTMSIMMDNLLRQFCIKLKEPTSSITIPKSFKKHLTKSSCMTLTCTYILNLVSDKAFHSLLPLLGVIAEVYCSEDVQLLDGFFHHLGCLFSEVSDGFSEEQEKTILRNFYLPCCCSDDGMLFTCRYVWLGAERIPKPLLDELIPELEQNSQRSDLLAEHFQALMNHIQHKGT